MELWTLCADKTKWENSYMLRRSDSMGNVVDKINESKNAPVFKKEYPDDFLDQFKDLLDSYECQIDENESYSNDDYPDEDYDSHYKGIRPISAFKIVVSEGVPVGVEFEQTEYAGGMDNRTWRYLYVLYFEDGDRSKGEKFNSYMYNSRREGRYSYSTTYKIVKKNQ